MSAVAYRQQGVALLTVVLIISIVTILATAMATRQQMDIRRAANVLTMDQLDQYARVAESAAIWLLKDDIAATTGDQYDTTDEGWASPIAHTFEGDDVAGELIDLNRYLNVNNLVDEAGNPVTVEVNRMRRLFNNLGLPQPVDLVDALVDWIDPDQQRSPNGAEDGEYLMNKPPYRTADRYMLSISELWLVRGFNKKVRDTLVDDNGDPLLTALPRNANYTSKVNVNTAPWQIIQASLENMTQGAAEDLADEEFTKLSDFMGKPKVNTAPNAGAIEPTLDVSSDYFLLEGWVSFGNRELTTYSILNRDNTGNSVVIYRSQGVY